GWTGSVSARRSYIDLLLPLVIPSSTVTAAPIYYDYQAGVHREVGNGRLVLFAFGSNDSLRVISKDPANGNIDLGTEIGFHKIIASWVTNTHGWVNRLSPSYDYERVRFGAGALAINESANVFALRDDLSRVVTTRLTLRAGFDGEIRR